MGQLAPSIKPQQHIPLFPLGVVLFPGMPLPLHIFEERYKQMIRECLHSQTVFGVVYYTGENFYSIGCTALLKKVVKKFDDGRMNILTEGRERFVIQQITNDKPYLMGNVELFDDVENDDPSDISAWSLRAVTLFKDALKIGSKNKTVDVPTPINPKELSFMIAATAGFSLNEKQAFLEMRSTGERLKKSSSALKRLIDRLKATKEIESLISGNGYLHNKKF